ncbi:hypothetical protein ACSMX9_06410 [Streptomyces sp. LE64]|uniref:hypothetical protein n=1 Tax=Streptomyces sp. LE64 TaxID=3448653 RepID=UPI00404152CA
MAEELAAAAATSTHGSRSGPGAAEHDRYDDPLTTLLRAEAAPEELAAADAVVLLVDHDEFDYEAAKLRARYVLDCRNRLSGPNVDVL